MTTKLVLTAITCAAAASTLWLWQRRRRVALDPANWPQGLPAGTLIKYTKIYLQSCGWRFATPHVRTGIMIRAFKKPFMLNLYVTEPDETHARIFLFDATDRNHRETYRTGVLTQDVISDDIKAWADHYAILVIHPRDLRDIEKLMRENQRRLVSIQEGARRATHPAAGRPAAEPETVDDSGRAPAPLAAETVPRLAPPAENGGRREAVVSLRGANSPEDLRTVLLAVQDRFAGQAWVLQEAAGWARRHRAWKLLAELALELVELYPTVADGYRAGARAQHELGWHDAAEQFSIRAAMQFPDEAWPLVEAAQAAQSRGAWAQATEIAAVLRARFPTDETGYRVGAFCLIQSRQFTEAEAVLTQATAILGPLAWAMADHARLARMQANWQEARRRWEAYRLAFPDRPEGYVEGAIALRGLAEFDLADALLGEAAKLFPNHPGVLDQSARVAQGRRDWVECDRRWQLARAACPDDKAIALAHAESPARGLFNGKRDWDEAFRRFDALHAAFPDLAEGYIAHLRYLCKAKRYERASEVANAAIARLPHDVGVVLAVAQISEACGKLQEAAAHYQRACDAFPASHTAPVRLAATLAKLGRASEADALCEAAIERFPAQPEVYCEYAELAMLRHDWAVAHDRWTEASGRFPFEPHIRKRLHHASLALAESAGQHAASPVTRAQGSTSDAPMTLADLIGRFESLGGTRQGCEFGLVQRALGAEPLGLLRWMHITLDGLVACLENDFEGVGTAEQTELGFLTGMQAERNEVGDDPEYVMSDRRYRMSGHTFTRPSQIPFEKMFAQSCRRMAFLRRKLLDDLAAGEKIFVFKLGDRVLSDEELDRLYRALRRHGDTTLLYVRSRTDTHPSGSAELLKPGLIVGYIERFSVDEHDVLRAPDLPAWTSICKEAWRLRFGEQQISDAKEEVHIRKKEAKNFVSLDTCV